MFIRQNSLVLVVAISHALLWQNLSTDEIEQVRKLWSRVKASPLPVFISQVLLGHRHTHLFTYFLRLLLSYVYRAEQWRQRPYVAQTTTRSLAL